MIELFTSDVIGVGIDNELLAAKVVALSGEPYGSPSDIRRFNRLVVYERKVVQGDNFDNVVAYEPVAIIFDTLWHRWFLEKSGAILD